MIEGVPDSLLRMAACVRAAIPLSRSTTIRIRLNLRFAELIRKKAGTKTLAGRKYPGRRR